LLAHWPKVQSKDPRDIAKISVFFIADIEKAFLMISVNPKDRDVLRFLWAKDPFSSELEIAVLRFT